MCDSELLTLLCWGAKWTCWKGVALISLPFPQQRKQEFVKHGPDREVGEQSYLTFNYSETESPSCLTTVTNSKGPTRLLIMMTLGSITIWGQIRIWSWNIPPLSANPLNFPILNRASFRKKHFSLYSLPNWILAVMILLNRKIKLLL